MLMKTSWKHGSVGLSMPTRWNASQHTVISGAFQWMENFTPFADISRMRAKRISAGEILDVTLPVWRIAEGLLFASRFAETFDEVDEIAIQCRFTGLNGRRLISITGKRFFPGGDISSTDEVALTCQATPQQVRDNLAEILYPLLLPLYERFNFFKLPFSLVEEELGGLLSRHF